MKLDKTFTELSGCNAHPELLQFGEVGHIPDPLYAIVCKVKGHQVHLENDIWQLFCSSTFYTVYIQHICKTCVL